MNIEQKKARTTKSRSESIKDTSSSNQRKRSSSICLDKEYERAIHVDSPEMKIVKIGERGILSAVYRRKEDKTFIVFANEGLVVEDGDQTKMFFERFKKGDIESIILIAALYSQALLRKKQDNRK